MPEIGGSIKLKPIAVLGAGSWGTALAIHLARAGLDIRLWGNEPDHMESLRRDRCNNLFLPEIAFPESLSVYDDLQQALQSVAWILLAIPSHAFRSFLHASSDLIAENTPVVWASKGLEEGTGKLLHQVINEELPQCSRFAVISGPTFAREVAMNMPTAISVAANTVSLAEEVSNVLHHGNFRAYTSEDIIGVETGGALKNVLAIAAGTSDGLGFGANARAALITRGLSEIMRLGTAMGGQIETFMGLAGLGDLVLTCTDDQSRNRRMGLMLAKGLSKEQIRIEIGQEIEGVRTAREVVRLAEQYDVEMPIFEQAYRVLYEGLAPADAVKHLLERKLTSEMIN